jgi:hypothetical protein
MINSLDKKEDIELYKSVGMIAEDDTAKEFIEKMLKPRYDAWKSGHQPSNGNNYGYIVSTRNQFGKNSVSDTGMFLKGLNVEIMEQSFKSMYDYVSLGAMLYPRELTQDAILAGKNSKIDHDKSDSVKLLNSFTMINTLDKIFSVRDTSDTSEFRYDGWDSQVYQKFPVDSRGVVKCLEHIKKQNPELGSECNRVAGVYKDLLGIVDNNPKVLEYMMTERDYGTMTSNLEYNKKRIEAEKFLAQFCKDQGLSENEAYWTMYYMRTTSVSKDLPLRDGAGNQKTDSQGNLIKVNIGDYFKQHQSEYPGKTVDDFLEAKNWSSNANVQSLVKGEVPEEHEKWNAISKLATKENYCDIRRKILEIYDIKLEGTSSSFDTSSNDPDYWENTSRVYNRTVNQNDELDAVLANLQYIAASAKVGVDTANKVSYKTRPSKANDNGNSLSKTFDFYRSTGFGYDALYLQEKVLSVDEVNSTRQQQLDAMPTFSKKWFDDSKSYVDKSGNEAFKSSYWSDAPSTEQEKKCAKAFSVDLGSKASISEYMGTPVGDLITAQCEMLSRYCPQMKTPRFNTQEKVAKQVRDKLGYKPFQVANDTPQASSNVPELRQLREELFSKVHCSLKTCDSVQYDAVQTEIKHNWDMGKRDSSGKRLYGHISGIFKNAYKVNNSIQEERMLENAKKLNETPQSFFHGTNHSGATGIIGVDGRFRAPKSSADASKQGLKYAGGMLGSGVYLAKMAGKSAGYFGTWGSSYEPEGCMLMCKAVLGNTYVSSNFSTSSAAPASYDTVSMQAGTNTGRTVLRADEWCVRNPDFVFPEYIVDMGTKRR